MQSCMSSYNLLDILQHAVNLNTAFSEKPSKNETGPTSSGWVPLRKAHKCQHDSQMGTWRLAYQDNSMCCAYQGGTAGQVVLDHSATGNDAVLDDDNNAILDDETLILSVGFRHTILVQDLDVAPDACIFVNDALADVGVGACRRRHIVLKCSSMVLPAAGSQAPSQDMAVTFGLSCAEGGIRLSYAGLPRPMGRQPGMRAHSSKVS